MKSTDMHINEQNVTKLDINSLQAGSDVYYESQYQYDAKSLKDETAVYIINDANPPRMFKGSREIPLPRNQRRYFLTYDEEKRKYIVFLDDIKDFKNMMVPVCEYNDPQIAMKALMTYNAIQEHSKTILSCYSILDSYIVGNTGIDDAILSIISVNGFKNDAGFQFLRELSIRFMDDKLGRDLTYEHREFLQKKTEHQLTMIYGKIYNVFVKNNFFKSYKTVDSIDSKTMQIFSRDLFNIFHENSIHYSENP